MHKLSGQIHDEDVHISVDFFPEHSNDASYFVDPSNCLDYCHLRGRDLFFRGWDVKTCCILLSGKSLEIYKVKKKKKPYELNLDVIC